MKIGRRGIAKIAIVAIVVAAVVVVAVVAVLLLRPNGGANSLLKSNEGANPKPGASLTGPIDIKSEKASSGAINFTISDDGTSVTWISITLNDVDVGVFTAGSMSQEKSISIPVSGGAFSDSVDGMGKIEGRFTSPTEASGTINLALDVYQVGPVEFGTWNWSAKAE